MGARYPVPKSQRSTSPAPVHFPRPKPVAPPPALTPPGANDNFPRPVNDNRRPRLKGPLAGIRGPAGRAAIFAIGAYVVDRIYPHEWFRQTALEGGFSAPGWTHHCTSPCSFVTGGPFRWISAKHSQNPPPTPGCSSGCASAQAIVGNEIGAGTVPADHNILHIYYQATNSAGDPLNFMRHMEAYSRTAPGPTAPPANESDRPALPLELPEPIITPMIDPTLLPIGQPAAWPRSIPYRVLPEVNPNPDRHPDTQPRRGPRPALRPRPRYSPRPGPGLPDLLVTPQPAPGHGPTVEVNPPPLSSRNPRLGSAGGFSGSPPHRSEPPGKRTRERKTLASPKAAAWVRFALSGVTEGLDALNALWDALPPWAKTMIPGERTSPQQMARDLWNAAGRDDIDWGKFASDAVENLIAEQLSDYLFGTIGRVAGKAGRSNGWVFGPQAGPWDNPRRPQGREDQAQTARKEL